MVYIGWCSLRLPGAGHNQRCQSLIMEIALQCLLVCSRLPDAVSAWLLHCSQRVAGPTTQDSEIWRWQYVHNICIFNLVWEAAKKSFFVDSPSYLWGGGVLRGPTKKKKLPREKNVKLISPLVAASLCEYIKEYWPPTEPPPPSNVNFQIFASFYIINHASSFPETITISFIYFYSKTITI